MTAPENWTIGSMKMCPNIKTPNPNIGLDNILAYDIELETTAAIPMATSGGSGKKRGMRKITLYGVPMFLVQAFTWLEKNNAFNVVGIFRVPGNQNRIIGNHWRIFCGLDRIPANYTVHDVCTLIKQFFRTLRTPILAEQQAQITSYVTTISHEKIQAEAMLSFVDRLPLENQATLGYLMRQLKKISELSETNKMTVANLAQMFAPAIFKEHEPMMVLRPTYSSAASIWSNSDGCCSTKFVSRSLQSLASYRRKKGDSQESLREISFAKQRESLQSSVVQLLIQYANHICVPRMGMPPAPMRIDNGCNHLVRKASDLQHQRSPIPSLSSTGSSKTGTGNVPQQREQRRGRTPSRRSDKIWPRSASENPFLRTRALFTLPFGKNGSFAPKETQNNQKQMAEAAGTPNKVHQSRPPIPYQSPPVANQSDVDQPVAINFISPSHGGQQQLQNGQQNGGGMVMNGTLAGSSNNMADGAANSSIMSVSSTSSKLLQRFFS